MKKKLFYVSILLICLCVFTTASKECGKLVCKDSTSSQDTKEIKTAAQREEQGNSKTDFSLVNLLFFQTI
ncbi:MAG TPA: hypothetical protein VNV85_18045 [Puia sp.]|jgi:hypothetical protein|nr:hypothetical protein [Puia sp.]